MPSRRRLKALDEERRQEQRAKDALRTKHAKAVAALFEKQAAFERFFADAAGELGARMQDQDAVLELFHETAKATGILLQRAGPAGLRPAAKSPPSQAKSMRARRQAQKLAREAAAPTPASVYSLALASGVVTARHQQLLLRQAWREWRAAVRGTRLLRKALTRMQHATLGRSLRRWSAFARESTLLATEAQLAQQQAALELGEAKARVNRVLVYAAHTLNAKHHSRVSLSPR